MGNNEGLCRRCGEIEPHGMDCGCPTEPCFGLAQPAPAPLPRSAHAFECPLSHPLGKICTCGVGEHSRKPAPAPLPAMYTRCPKCGGAEFPANAGCSCDYNALKDLQARYRELEADFAASKQNEWRWIAKGEEVIAERNAANAALEAIKKHQEIVAGTGAAQMSTTWKIADAHLRSIGNTRAALAATEASA